MEKLSIVRLVLLKIWFPFKYFNLLVNYLDPFYPLAADYEIGQHFSHNDLKEHRT